MILVEAAQHMIVSKHAPKDGGRTGRSCGYVPASVFSIYDLYYPLVRADYIVERIETLRL